MTVSVGNIREWRGQDVLDDGGSKIGSLEAVYVDTTTDQPSFATVEVGGMIGGHRLVFVPLAGSTVGPKYLQVAYPKSVVKDAPHIDTDGELPAEREPQVFAHYGLAHDTAGGVRRLARR